MRKVHKSRCWKLCVIKRWRRLLSASEGKLKQVMNAFLVMKYKFASDSDSRNCEGYQNGHRTTQKRNSIYVKKSKEKAWKGMARNKTVLILRKTGRTLTNYS